MKKEAMNILSKGNVKQCIELLIDYCAENNLDDLYSKIIQVSARYNNIEGMYLKNVISNDFYLMEINKITNAILEYIRFVDEK